LDGRLEGRRGAWRCTKAAYPFDRAACIAVDLCAHKTERVPGG